MNLYTILPVNPLEYKTEILRLWERNHSDIAPLLPKRFTWIYENNPYGTPKCWLLKHNKISHLFYPNDLLGYTKITLMAPQNAGYLNITKQINSLVLPPSSLAVCM